MQRSRPSSAQRRQPPQLDPEQMAAVTAPRGPVCIIAGAGTGKTRTITHRIAHLCQQGQVNPSQVLAVTFTARAAGEMRERLAGLGVGAVGQPGGSVQAVTFHAAALRQLRFFWSRVYGEQPWELLTAKFAPVSAAVDRVGLRSDKETVRDVLSEIEWAKGSLIAAQDYPSTVATRGRAVPLDAEKIAEAYRAYEDLKRSRTAWLLDFDDLLVHMIGALENVPAVADEFASRYRSFVVDEYQDVTPLQQRLLDNWLGERDDLTVVGDANQTIYSFTGATPEYLLDFSRRFEDATVVRLHRDYRSTPEVVRLANDVIGAARGRIASTRLHLEGQRPSGPVPRVTRYADETAEADGVARDIAEAIAQGADPSEIAILYRVNAQSVAYEQALTAVSVPYQVRGGEGFFQREEVRRALTALARTAARTDLPAEATGVRLVPLVRAVLVDLGLTKEPPEAARARERWESLDALVRLTEDMVAVEPDLTPEGLVKEFRARQDAKQPPIFHGVTLASLHAAKGLEWDRVYLVGLTEGTLPIRHALGDSAADDAIEEERRLLYVGVTRAREHLTVTWAAARRAGGRERRRSRFLDDALGPEEPVRTAQPIDVASRAAAARSERKAARERALQDLPEESQELFRRLQEWRADRARDIKKPAYVIFSDATLLEIAEKRPDTQRDLVRIGGIGAVKLEQFGAEVLALLRGEFVDDGGR